MAPYTSAAWASSTSKWNKASYTPSSLLPTSAKVTKSAGHSQSPSTTSNCRPESPGPSSANPAIPNASM
jgi:hypothetical protein